MAAIRDDGAALPGSLQGEGPDALRHYIQPAVAAFDLDPLRGQLRRPAVMCEAGGMRPQLERVAQPYGVQVIASGGFDSLTAKHSLAALVAEACDPVEVLHIGDHDDAGEGIFRALAEDVGAFAAEMGGDVVFTRLAVTTEQIDRIGLPTAFAKPGGRLTHIVQAEAIPPDELARILDTALRDRLDLALIERQSWRTARIRVATQKRLQAARLWGAGR